MLLCCLMLYQQYFSYIMVVMWCMRSEGERPSLHSYRLKVFFTGPHYVDIVWEEQAFDDTVSYTQCGKWIAAQTNDMVVIVFIGLPPKVACHQCLNQLPYLPTHLIHKAIVYCDHNQSECMMKISSIWNSYEVIFCQDKFIDCWFGKELFIYAYMHMVIYLYIY